MTRYGKAGGQLGVESEMLQASGEPGIDWLTDLPTVSYEKGKYQKIGWEAYLFLFTKEKGDPLGCGLTEQ